MLKRQLTDFGIHPFLGFVIIIAGFLGFSFFLFSRSHYASYIYCLISISIVFKYSEINRNDFLKFNFSKKNYIKVRILENVLTALPFIIFLCVQKEIYPALLLTVLAAAIILVNSKSSFSVTLPTPFYKRPFEFIAGFRTSVIVFIAAYFVTVMSIIYQNFHLGICSLLFVFLICLSFYNEPEDVFYVWINKKKVNGFLFNKIITAIIFSSLLSLPVTIALLLFFKTHLLLIIAFQLLGYAYLLAMVLAKYASFPQKMNLPQGIILILSITMPPVLLVAIPFFYFQSQKRLKDILE